MVECMPWMEMTQAIAIRAKVYEITKFTKNMKNIHEFTTLPVNHTKWHKINKITLGNNLNANTIPDNGVEAIYCI